MNEKPVKVDIGFNEALRRIAKTPKDAVLVSDEKLVNAAKRPYNRKKVAAKPPLPGSRKTT